MGIIVKFRWEQRIAWNFLGNLFVSDGNPPPLFSPQV